MPCSPCVAPLLFVVQLPVSCYSFTFLLVGRNGAASGGGGLMYGDGGGKLPPASHPSVYIVPLQYRPGQNAHSSSQGVQPLGIR